MNLSDASLSSGWLARLELDFNVASKPVSDPGEALPTPDALRTRLTHRHLGPLRIQKALYPEGPSLCQAIVVHPPGGIAGGDRLELRLESRLDSQGLVTTPSAAKWYGTDFAAPATQHIDMTVEGSLEWLPQETIVFDRARVNSDICIEAGAKGAMLGWDHLIFGRRASGESFKTGRFAQSLTLKLSDALIWHDRVVLEGDDALFESPIGLRGHHAFATLWALVAEPQTWTESLVETVRAQSPQIAWTVLHPRLLVGRVLVEPLKIKGLLEQAWSTLRPIVLKRPALNPRLWAT